MNTHKNLIKHFWNTNREEVVARSLLNCHVRGMHSVMLFDKPGQRIRLFYASPQHELWKNDRHEWDAHFLSLGYHQHHCDLVLDVIKGMMTNYTITVTTEMADLSLGKSLYSYQWKSPILNKEGRFVRSEERKVMCFFDPGTEHWAGTRDSSVRLEPSTYHTVSVNEGESAAWLVFEGAEWQDYKPITLSNDPRLDSWEGALYQRPSEAEVRAVLQQAIGESLG